MELVAARKLATEVGGKLNLSVFIRETETPEFFHLIVTEQQPLNDKAGTSGDVDGMTVTSWKTVHLNGQDPTEARELLCTVIGRMRTKVDETLRQRKSQGTP